MASAFRNRAGIEPENASTQSPAEQLATSIELARTALDRLNDVLARVQPTREQLPKLRRLSWQLVTTSDCVAIGLIQADSFTGLSRDVAKLLHRAESKP